MKLRYVTWSAVSTKAQRGPDKVSLKVQLEKSKAEGESRGWVHVRDYVVPGQSRTKYISLNIAEKHIPELHAMLDAAYRGEFDILIVYDLNRFRTLMRQVFDALCDCGIQLYILADPREPVPSNQYSNEKKNEMAMLIGLRGIISDNELSGIQKHYRDKMPRRITDKGLHAGLGLPPYGYRKPQGKELDHNAVLVQVPSEAAIIYQIKDWFFAGCSETEIAHTLNAQHIPSPRGKNWWYPQIRYMLANSFYAGIVSFGITRWERNRREGTVIRRKSTPITNTGKHIPLWDLATHQRILAELDRRGKAHPGIKTRQLSRLLHCWCGAVMWATQSEGRHAWRCSKMIRGHSWILDLEGLQKLTSAIVRSIEHLSDINIPSPTDARPGLISELHDLQRRKQRWMDDYEAGTLNRDDFHARIDPINARVQRTEEKLRQNDITLSQAATTRETLRELSKHIATLPDHYINAPPTQVNAELRLLLERVIVGKDHEFELKWR